MFVYYKIIEYCDILIVGIRILYSISDNVYAHNVKYFRRENNIKSYVNIYTRKFLYTYNIVCVLNIINVHTLSALHIYYILLFIFFA